MIPTQISSCDPPGGAEVPEAGARPPSGPGQPRPAGRKLPAPIVMLGVPFDKVTTADTLRIIEEMVGSGLPHYAATANVDFAVQALADVELRRLLMDADLVLCDGMPLVWASRFLGNPLPERVTGSDLVPQVLMEAEQKGWRVFFLGGAQASLDRAAEKVQAKHPRLKLVGCYSPPFKPLLEMDHDDVVRRVREARPDILLVAFGCPKQEKWIGMHFQRTGVPFSIGVGATIDFLAGSVRRAPVWMQRTGLEWVFRLLQEPKRLARRYGTDIWVFARAILRQWWEFRGRRRHASRPTGVASQPTPAGLCEVVRFDERIDAAAVQRHEELWTSLLEGEAHLLADLSKVRFIDSTGIGLLVRFQKRLRAADRQLVLIAPTQSVTHALSLMRLDTFFATAPDATAARGLIHERTAEENVVGALNLSGRQDPLVWQGEIVASTEENVWATTKLHLEHAQGRQSELEISLAQVRFIDSSGVGLMMRVRKEARRRAIELKFTSPQPAVLNVLRILRMEKHLLG